MYTYIYIYIDTTYIRTYMYIYIYIYTSYPLDNNVYDKYTLYYRCCYKINDDDALLPIRFCDIWLSKLRQGRYHEDVSIFSSPYVCFSIWH